MNYNISKDAFNRIRSICYRFHFKNKQHYRHRMILNELKIRVFVGRLFMHKTFNELSEEYGISRYSASNYYREILFGLYAYGSNEPNQVKFKVKERYVYDNLREFL